MLTSAAVQAQSTVPFVPDSFQVPATLETREFRLRMLTVNDVVKDYDAVMSSVERVAWRTRGSTPLGGEDLGCERMAF
jgi:hypothetical protein